MNPKIDIHEYEKRYEWTVKQLDQPERGKPISKSNKRLILDFDKFCVLDHLSLPRRAKLINSLNFFARHYLKKDFDKATKEDLKDAIMLVEERNDYSVWTKQSYRAITKKFFKWIVQGDECKIIKEYPEIVSWISTTIKAKDKPKVQASDILTEDEVHKLIDVAEYTRDKCFVAMLYELGARVSEIGNLRYGDITKDKFGYVVDLSGKTGHRTPLLITSSPYITAWLNEHPTKKSESPLWVMIGSRDKEKKMVYGTLRALIKRLVKKTEIKKRVHPHLFRHSRVTHALANGEMSEAQAEIYFGWIPGTKMMAEYSHLVSKDVNDARKKFLGLVPKEEEKTNFKKCLICDTINSKKDVYCMKCFNPLDKGKLLELHESDKIHKKILVETLKDKRLKEYMATFETVLSEKAREFLEKKV